VPALSACAVDGSLKCLDKHSLRETPLLPILLKFLAAEKSSAELPAPPDEGR
jgi:hypothetical protein